MWPRPAGGSQAAVLVESGGSQRISGFPAAGALTGSELVPLVQSAIDVQSTLSNLGTAITPAAILVESGSGAKISALSAAGALDGSELAVIVQGGADKKVTLANIVALAAVTLAGDVVGAAGSNVMETVVSTNATASGTVVVDFSTARIHNLTLTGNITTLTLQGAVNGKGCALTFYLTQDGTGGRTMAWPASIKWAGGLAPTLSTAPAAVDVVVLETLDGGTTWWGNLAGKAYA